MGLLSLLIISDSDSPNYLLDNIRTKVSGIRLKSFKIIKNATFVVLVKVELERKSR